MLCFGCIQRIVEVQAWAEGPWAAFVGASGESVRGMWECEPIFREPKSLSAAGFAGAVLVGASPSAVPGAAIRCHDCPTFQVRVPGNGVTAWSSCAVIYRVITRVHRLLKVLWLLYTCVWIFKMDFSFKQGLFLAGMREKRRKWWASGYVFTRVASAPCLGSCQRCCSEWCYHSKAGALGSVMCPLCPCCSSSQPRLGCSECSLCVFPWVWIPGACATPMEES